MVQTSVHCTQHLTAEADVVWAHLRDFCAPWHPLIATMKAEVGGRVRAFTVMGEDTLYRERLAWFSDTGRSMSYMHLEGIEGAHRYEGRLSVTPADKGGCVVSMSAESEATAARAEEIASGTEFVFETGLKALTESALKTLPVTKAEMVAAPVTHRMIDDLPRLAISETADTGGPLCLFLHGIGGNRSNWDNQLGLAGAILHSAAMDFRGYGDSTLGSEQTRVEDYCDDILRVCEVLGADKLVLCGLSYGSWIATSFAQRYPKMLAGLVLAGGCTGMSEAGPEQRDGFRASREVPLDAGQAPADFAQTVVNAIAGPKASDAARAALVASMGAISVATYRDALQCFTNPPEQFDFSKLEMPVLIMTGEYDRLAPPTEIAAVAARIYATVKAPDVRFEIIKGAGHVCNLEDGSAFNAPLFEFLRRLR